MTPPTPDAAVFAARISPTRNAESGARNESRDGELLPIPPSAFRLPPSLQMSVVVPLFDEQDTLPELYRRLTAVLRGLGAGYELVLVDDGSRDATPVLLDAYAAADPCVTAVHLSRNFGHQAAVTAGLDLARGHAVVVMDGDLQDPPELIPRLVERWRAGGEVVYAVRAKRAEGPAKRLGYWLFYRLLRAVSDLEIPLDAGDFCLLDRRAADALNRLPERTRFVRGLRAFVGFRQAGVEYDRDPRLAGRSKYTASKLIRLAATGLVGFSGFPLRAVGGTGIGLTGLGLLAGAGAVFDAVQHAGEPRGWAVLAALVLAVGGLQLIAAGVIGEYVRRVFVEVTGRPAYIVRDVTRQPAGGPRVRTHAGSPTVPAPHLVES